MDRYLPCTTDAKLVSVMWARAYRYVDAVRHALHDDAMLPSLPVRDSEGGPRSWNQTLKVAGFCKVSVQCRLHDVSFPCEVFEDLPITEGSKMRP